MKFYFNGKRHYSRPEFLWDKSVAPNALSFLDFYGFGSDTFICDQFDTLIDFDLYERDEIIGPCSVEYLVEEEEEIEKIPEYDSNIFPLEVEEFERLHSQTKLLTPTTTTAVTTIELL